MSRRPPAGLPSVPMTMPGFLVIPGCGAGISDGTPRPGALVHGRHRKVSATLPTPQRFSSLIVFPWRRRPRFMRAASTPGRVRGAPVDMRGERPDERQIAVTLRVVEPVTDHELVGD